MGWGNGGVKSAEERNRACVDATPADFTETTRIFTRDTRIPGQRDRGRAAGAGRLVGRAGRVRGHPVRSSAPKNPNGRADLHPGALVGCRSRSVARSEGRSDPRRDDLRHAGQDHAQSATLDAPSEIVEATAARTRSRTLPFRPQDDEVVAQRRDRSPASRGISPRAVASPSGAMSSIRIANVAPPCAPAPSRPRAISGTPDAFISHDRRAARSRAGPPSVSMQVRPQRRGWRAVRERARWGQDE
jgi:hypothetical protein